MDRRHLISSLIILLLVALALFLIRATGAEQTGETGLVQTLRDMTVLQGGVPDHNEMGRRPTLLVAWNTGCPSCVYELRHLKEHYDELRDDVNIIAVNLTRTERSREAVEEFLAQEDLPYTVLADEDGRLTDHLTFRFIPANFLLGTDGELRESREGLIDVQSLRTWLQ